METKALLRLKFDPAWKRFTALREMRINDDLLQAGDEFPTKDANVRQRRMLFTCRRICPILDASEAEAVGVEVDDNPQEGIPVLDTSTMSFNEKVAYARTLGLTGRIPPKADLEAFLAEKAPK